METQRTKKYICKLVYFTHILRNNVNGAGLCCNVYIFLTHNYLCCDSLFSHKVFARIKVQYTPTRILLTPIPSSSIVHQLQGTKEKRLHFASLLPFGLNIADD